MKPTVILLTSLALVTLYVLLPTATKPRISPDSKLMRKAFDGINTSAISTRMEARKKLLEGNCWKLGLTTHQRPNPWEFLISRQYKLVWCNVFKAASTTWLYNFNILAGYSPKILKKTKAIPLVLARNRYPRPTLLELEAALRDSTSFLIVRHPFERLISAYNDKIKHTTLITYQKLAKKIITTFRSQNVTNPPWPTFKEFVAHILSRNRAGLKLDMHWTPITKFCSPCAVHFDVILKFETLKDDQLYLIRKAKLDRLLKVEWKNQGVGAPVRVLLKEYYSQLPQNQLRQLYQLYRHDFELFNYTFDT